MFHCEELYFCFISSFILRFGLNQPAMMQCWTLSKAYYTATSLSNTFLIIKSGHLCSFFCSLVLSKYYRNNWKITRLSITWRSSFLGRKRKHVFCLKGICFICFEITRRKVGVNGQERGTYTWFLRGTRHREWNEVRRNRLASRWGWLAGRQAPDWPERCWSNCEDLCCGRWRWGRGRCRWCRPIRWRTWCTSSRCRSASSRRVRRLSTTSHPFRTLPWTGGEFHRGQSSPLWHQRHHYPPLESQDLLLRRRPLQRRNRRRRRRRWRTKKDDPFRLRCHCRWSLPHPRPKESNIQSRRCSRSSLAPLAKLVSSLFLFPFCGPFNDVPWCGGSWRWCGRRWRYSNEPLLFSDRWVVYNYCKQFFFVSQNLCRREVT